MDGFARDLLGLTEANTGTQYHVAGRDQNVETRLVAGCRNLFLMLCAIGKHAQIQHGARAIGEIDDGETVIKNVGLTTIIALVLMVHIHIARAIDARWL